MILINRRRLAGALFCIMIASALLISCRGGNEQPDLMREIADNLSSMKVDTVQDQGALYEITQFASPQDNAVLCCAGLYDESHLLLLYSAPDSQGAVSSYSAQLLSLLSGEKEEIASFDRSRVTGRGSDGTEGLSILSCDPLIVFDSRCGILYRPGIAAGSVSLPSYLSDAVPYYLGGRLWLSSGRGILYEVTDEGDIRACWTLPCEFGAFTPVVCGHEGRLSYPSLDMLC